MCCCRERTVQGFLHVAFNHIPIDIIQCYVFVGGGGGGGWWSTFTRIKLIKNCAFQKCYCYRIQSLPYNTILILVVSLVKIVAVF